MNTEEAFVLSTLVEFVRSWGSGCQSILQLECKDNQVWCNFSTKLGAPADPHFLPHVPHPPHHGFRGPAHQRRHPRRKGPAQRERDRARAAAHRATQENAAATARHSSDVCADTSSTPSPTPPPSLPTQPSVPDGSLSAETQTAVPAASALPFSDRESASVLVLVITK